MLYYNIIMIHNRSNWLYTEHFNNVHYSPSPTDKPKEQNKLTYIRSSSCNVTTPSISKQRKCLAFPSSNSAYPLSFLCISVLLGVELGIGSSSYFTRKFVHRNIVDVNRNRTIDPPDSAEYSPCLLPHKDEVLDMSLVWDGLGIYCNEIVGHSIGHWFL